jgi:hypothetical protein
VSKDCKRAEPWPAIDHGSAGLNGVITKISGARQALRYHNLAIREPRPTIYGRPLTLP